MRALIRLFQILALLSAFFAAAALSGFADDHSALVIVFKDGHRQTVSTAELARIDVKAPAAIVYKNGQHEKITGEIARIEFGSSTSASVPGRAHFVGKWEVGEGVGSRHFFITLEENGTARKSIGSPGGTWTLVDGEAHIAWDDGWHDAIRKVSGGKHEKMAFEPGKSFDDQPSNVEDAKNLENKPI
jgi:hypothetical protein